MRPRKQNKHPFRFLTIALGICCTAQLTLAQLPAITTGWKLQPGNDPTWSAIEFDDTKWQSTKVGVEWEKQLGDYDGYGWYRLHIRIPASVRETPKFKKQNALSLALGRIDDVDRTWFNGREIGSTGSFPDDYSAAWQSKRTYRIPESIIRWDADNVIAVRVYDGDGNGGMLEGPYDLKIANTQTQIEFELGSENPDGIFHDENRTANVTITVKLANPSNEDETSTPHWTIQTDDGKHVTTASTKVTLPATQTIKQKTTFPAEPGFYQVTCELLDDDNEVSSKHSRIVGFNPERITSPLTQQPDLDEFWKTTLATLSSVEPQFEMTRAPDRDSETHEVYEVEMRSLNNVRVGGWYQKPKAAGSHPALIRVPGYTSSMFPIETADPVAVFSFNVRAHGNSQKDVSGKPQDYWIRGLDNKEGYFYQGCYADCVRAVDFVCSRKEIDTSRIGITGGSQGGGLSLATAALDPRITACAPDIAFLCDWVKYFETTKWPEIDGWIAAKPERTWAATLQTMSYFDVMNLADRITCPVFFGIGLQDDVCPPATIFATYNRLNAPKQYHVYPHAKHWVGPPHARLRRQWLWKQLRVAK